MSDRSSRTATVPANRLPRGRLGRGVSQDLPDRRDGSASGAAVGGDQARASRPGCASERDRLERLRERQCRAAGPLAHAGDAIAAIRHVFLDVDSDGPGLLDSADDATAICRRRRTCSTHLQAGLHVFWRVHGFDAGRRRGAPEDIWRESSQTDPAATSCSQMTRLPGFVNHKRETPVPRNDRVPATELPCSEPTDFPEPATRGFQGATAEPSWSARRSSTRRWSAPVDFSAVRARNLRTARRPAHVSHLLSRGARVRAVRRRSALRAARVERTL